MFAPAGEPGAVHGAWTNSSLKSRNLQRVSKQREFPSFGFSSILPQRTTACTRSYSPHTDSGLKPNMTATFLPKLLSRVAQAAAPRREESRPTRRRRWSDCVPATVNILSTPGTARMDVGARHLGMPDGMLTRLVGERLYWKIVITFQISEPRGGKQQQQPHMRMPPPHFTILYMRAPCGGYPFQTSQSPQPALVPHAILQKLEELMQPFGAHPPPPDVIKKDPRYRVERAGTVHSLRTKIAAALDSQPGSFHWSSTCDSGLRNVHCTAGLPAGVPDHEGRVHFSKATLSKSLAPIAENLALHFALLGGRQQGDAGCEMTAFKVANLVAEADVPVSLAAECTWRSHVRGAACAG